MLHASSLVGIVMLGVHENDASNLPASYVGSRTGAPSSGIPNVSPLTVMVPASLFSTPSLLPFCASSELPSIVIPSVLPSAEINAFVPLPHDRPVNVTTGVGIE